MDNSGLQLVISSLPLLFKGLLTTFYIGIISMLIGTIFGVIFGIIRTFDSKIIKFVSRLFVELFRCIPILVWLFILFFSFPILFDINIKPNTTAIIVLSLWAITEIGEITRGAIESISKGQIESAKSIGLSSIQIYLYILLPQSIKRMIPSTINIYTRIIKTTSLAVLIGVIDVVKVAQQITERTGQAFLMYSTLFVLFFIICYPLSYFSKLLEKRFQI